MPASSTYDEDFCKFVIIHELGHAMGYTGHSPNTSAGALMRANMATLPAPVLTPTSQEEKFFKKIYDMYNDTF